jgi:hypothetical protein
MASNIIYDTIDGTFPVSGQDNSTQGFRDNFTIIKNSLSAARTEILTLQSSAVLKSPIDNSLNNDLVGAEIARPTLSQAVEKKSTTTLVTSSPLNVYFSSGHYQVFVVSTDLQLDIKWSTLTNEAVQRFRVELVQEGGSTAHNITIANTSIKKSSNWPGTFTLLQNEIAIIEFWYYKEPGSTHPQNTTSNPVTYANYLGKFS